MSRNLKLTARKPRGVNNRKPIAVITKNKLVKRDVDEYILTVTRRHETITLREVSRCHKHEVRNKSDGKLISSSSMAEIMSDTAAKAVAKKLNLPYRPFPPRYLLRTNQQFDLLHGFRQNHRRTKVLTARKLSQIADTMQLILKNNDGNNV